MILAIRRLIGSPFLFWFGLACVALIAVLSLTPASIQARTALPGEVEHILGYGVVALILTLGAQGKAFPWRVLAGMALFAIAVECLQFLSPGRNPEVIGAASSIAGAAAGVVAGYFLRSRIEAA